MPDNATNGTWDAGIRELAREIGEHVVKHPNAYDVNKFARELLTEKLVPLLDAASAAAAIAYTVHPDTDTIRELRKQLDPWRKP